MTALDPSSGSIGRGCFRARPSDDQKIHAYLAKEVNLAEKAVEKSTEFVYKVCQVTLEAFGTQKVKGE